MHIRGSFVTAGVVLVGLLGISAVTPQLLPSGGSPPTVAATSSLPSRAFALTNHELQLTAVLNYTAEQNTTGTRYNLSVVFTNHSKGRIESPVTEVVTGDSVLHTVHGQAVEHGSSSTPIISDIEVAGIPRSLTLRSLTANSSS